MNIGRDVETPTNVQPPLDAHDQDQDENYETNSTNYDEEGEGETNWESQDSKLMRSQDHDERTTSDAEPEGEIGDDYDEDQSSNEIEGSISSGAQSEDVEEELHNENEDFSEEDQTRGIETIYEDDGIEGEEEAREEDAQEELRNGNEGMIEEEHTTDMETIDGDDGIEGEEESRAEDEQEELRNENEELLEEDHIDDMETIDGGDGIEGEEGAQIDDEQEELRNENEELLEEGYTHDRETMDEDDGIEGEEGVGIVEQNISETQESEDEVDEVYEEAVNEDTVNEEALHEEAEEKQEVYEEREEQVCEEGEEVEEEVNEEAEEGSYEEAEGKIYEEVEEEVGEEIEEEVHEEVKKEVNEEVEEEANEAEELVHEELEEEESKEAGEEICEEAEEEPEESPNEDEGLIGEDEANVMETIDEDDIIEEEEGVTVVEQQNLNLQEEEGETETEKVEEMYNEESAEEAALGIEGITENYPRNQNTTENIMTENEEDRGQNERNGEEEEGTPTDQKMLQKQQQQQREQPKQDFNSVLHRMNKFLGEGDNDNIMATAVGRLTSGPSNDAPLPYETIAADEDKSAIKGLLEGNVSSSVTHKESSKAKGDNVKYPVGTTVEKFFKGHGIFTGTIVSYNKTKKFTLYQIIYTDGDEEEMYEKEVEKYLNKAITPNSSKDDDKKKPKRWKKVAKRKTPTNSDIDNDGHDTKGTNSSRTKMTKSPHHTKLPATAHNALKESVINACKKDVIAAIFHVKDKNKWASEKSIRKHIAAKGPGWFESTISSTIKVMIQSGDIDRGLISKRTGMYKLSSNFKKKKSGKIMENIKERENEMKDVVLTEPINDVWRDKFREKECVICGRQNVNMPICFFQMGRDEVVVHVTCGKYATLPAIDMPEYEISSHASITEEHASNFSKIGKSIINLGDIFHSSKRAESELPSTISESSNESNFKSTTYYLMSDFNNSVNEMLVPVQNYVFPVINNSFPSALLQNSPHKERTSASKISSSKPIASAPALPTPQKWTFRTSIMNGLVNCKNYHNWCSMYHLKKYIKENAPEDKTLVNATFLAVLKNMVESGLIIKEGGRYKLSKESKMKWIMQSKIAEAANPTTTRGGSNISGKKWTKPEKTLLMEGIKRYYKSNSEEKWNKISAVVKSRTVRQVKRYFEIHKDELLSFIETSIRSKAAGPPTGSSFLSRPSFTKMINGNVKSDVPNSFTNTKKSSLKPYSEALRKPRSLDKDGFRKGPWIELEIFKFMEGYKMYILQSAWQGKQSWQKLAEHVGTRTEQQTRNFFSRCKSGVTGLELPTTSSGSSGGKEKGDDGARPWSDLEIEKYNDGVKRFKSQGSVKFEKIAQCVGTRTAEEVNMYYCQCQMAGAGVFTTDKAIPIKKVASDAVSTPITVAPINTAVTLTNNTAVPSVATTKITLTKKGAKNITTTATIVPPLMTAADNPDMRNFGVWCYTEKQLFLAGYRLYKNDDDKWRKIAQHVGTRTIAQVTNYFNRYKKELELMSKNPAAALVGITAKTSNSVGWSNDDRMKFRKSYEWHKDAYDKWDRITEFVGTKNKDQVRNYFYRNKDQLTIRNGSWNDTEKSRFYNGYNLFQNDKEKWEKIALHIQTRTVTQVKNYYQKYKQQLGLKFDSSSPSATVVCDAATSGKEGTAVSFSSAKPPSSSSPSATVVCDAETSAKEDTAVSFSSAKPPSSSVACTEIPGKSTWSKMEKNLFLSGFMQYKYDPDKWTKISSIIQTKSPNDVSNYFYRYKDELKLTIPTDFRSTLNPPVKKQKRMVDHV